MNMLTTGMMMLSTSDLTMVPNAAPMMTPTARSTTLPLKAKLLNSSQIEAAFLAGLNVFSALRGSILFSASWACLAHARFDGGLEVDLSQRDSRRALDLQCIVFAINLK